MRKTTNMILAICFSFIYACTEDDDQVMPQTTNSGSIMDNTGTGGGIDTTGTIDTTQNLIGKINDSTVNVRNQTGNNCKTIIWFGNHGAAYGNFGMLNLLDIVEPLIKVSKEINFRLLVVSNNYKKYCKYIIFQIKVALPMIIITLYNIGKIDFSEAEVRK